MRVLVWVMFGGALGSGARYGLGAWITHLAASRFPWATLVVNVLGSFIIGFFATATAADGRWPAHDDFRQFFIAGILGGFTTFSAFSLQTLQLSRGGRTDLALLNIGSSVLICLLAVWLGHIAAAACSRS
jgi:CrcB protein